jgi:hypothetical protein
MSNSFKKEELQRYYNDVEKCLHCKKYKADCIHHCISRGKPFTNSILNASPLCNHSCHLPIHGEHMKRENQEKFISMNIERLYNEGYKINQLDLNFLAHHGLTDLIKDFYEIN